MNERIKLLRKKLDLTQTEFGKNVGHTITSIQKIEQTGKTSEATIIAICSVYNVRREWLETGEGEMFAPPPPGTPVNHFADDERFAKFSPELIEMCEEMYAVGKRYLDVFGKIVREMKYKCKNW